MFNKGLSKKERGKIIQGMEKTIFLKQLVMLLLLLSHFSRVRLCATPWIAAHQASLSITNSQSSPRLTSIESVMPSSHLILCRPLLLLAPIPPSIRVFSMPWIIFPLSFFDNPLLNTSFIYSSHYSFFFSSSWWSLNFLVSINFNTNLDFLPDVMAVCCFNLSLHHMFKVYTYIFKVSGLH